MRDLLNTVKSMTVKEDTRILTFPPTSTFDESRIRVDYTAGEKFHLGWKRNLSSITEAVVHHTEGSPSAEETLSWVIGGERAAYYKKGIALFHFLVGGNGNIIKTAPIARWYYHSCSGEHDALTVGIEVCHRSGAFTDQQYTSLSWLLFEYLPFHCPNYSRIVGHDYNFKVYSNNSKGCPGPEFSWPALEYNARGKGFAMSKIFDQAYSLVKA